MASEGVSLSGGLSAQRSMAQATTGLSTAPAIWLPRLAEILPLRLPIQLAACSPSQMPSGQPKIESATLASGLFTSFIKLRAATKLIGTERMVPTVVASSARKTVSMILSQVSRADCDRCGQPMLRRSVARMYCSLSLGRSGSLNSILKWPLSSARARTESRARVSVGSEEGTKLTGPSVPGCKLNPSTTMVSPGLPQGGVNTK